MPRLHPAPLACLLLLTACVPRAAYRRSVQNLEETRQVVELQQVAMAQLEAEVKRLEDRCGARRPSGPPPLAPTAYTVFDMRIPAMVALPHHQAELTMAVLNSAPGPCKVCADQGLTAAACLLEQSSCANMPAIVHRAIGMASRGESQEAIVQAIHYDQPWVAVDIGDAPTRGGTDAPVAIVMFMESQCPFCVRADATLRELEQRYGPKLRIVYKHFPLVFHTAARPAAIAMEAARRQGQFWAYQAAIYERARELQDDDEVLADIAAQLGLDVDRFLADLEDPALEARVDADIQQAEALGITGTPNFLINGYPLRGAQPAEKFAEIIDRELGDRAH